MSATTESRPPICPLCAGTEFRRVEPGFVRCSDCGLFQQDARRDPAALQLAIDARQAQADPPNAQPIMNCLGCEHEIAFLARNRPDILRGGRALDIGTALGNFVACLGASGANASGIEPDHRRAEIARRFGLDVREGRFGSIPGPFAGDHFDLVSIRECFYYLDDFDAALSTVRRILTERGVLYIKSHVADSPCYWGRIPRSRRVGPQCTAFFSCAQLLRILRDREFSIIATERNDFPPAFAAESWNLSPRLVGLARPLLRYAAKMIPPDRFMVLASSRAR